MFRIYSKEKARAIISGNSDLIKRICTSCRIPEAYLKAVLMMEIPAIDIYDYLADAAVSMNWLRYTLFQSYRPERHTKNPFRKYDSSTGYGQIFARVAIDAILFARSKGISLKTELPEIVSSEQPEDLRKIWFRLKTDREFNLICCALNLYHCADQMTGNTDFYAFTSDEIKLIFSRYNGNVKTITAYGEKAYQYYQEFCS